MLPAFLVIGGQRCGSTSLYSLLVQHPRIAPAFKKEVHYFTLYKDKVLDWYRAHFPRARSTAGSHPGNGGDLISGEATPYYLFHPLAAARVRAALPDVKLIAILREPVARAYSHYHHEVRKGRETKDFEEAVRLEAKRLEGEREKLLSGEKRHSFHHQRHSYLARGLYAAQLWEWLRSFPSEQLLVIDSRELFERARDTLRYAFEFLGLPDFEVPDRRAHNVGSYSRMNPSTRRELTEFFKPHNEELFDLLGRRFDW